MSSDLVTGVALIATEQLSIAAMTRSAAGSVDAPGTRGAHKAGVNQAILDMVPSPSLALVRYTVQDTGTALLIDAPTETVTDLSMLQRGPKEGPQRACAQARRVQDDLAP